MSEEERLLESRRPSAASGEGAGSGSSVSPSPPVAMSNSSLEGQAGYLIAGRSLTMTPSTISSSFTLPAHSSSLIPASPLGDLVQPPCVLDLHGASTLEVADEEDTKKQCLVPCDEEAASSCLSESESDSSLLMGLRKAKDSATALGECRICHEEDSVANLDNPCTCAGTLKYAHQSCLQHWCNEKRNTLCEICHQPYKSTYVAPEASLQEQSASSVLSIEIREESGPDGLPSRVLTLRDTVTGEETRFDLTEPEEPQDPWACCKMLVLAIFVLMFLPRALMLLVDMEDEAGDVSAAVLLRLIGIFLPMFLLVRVVSLIKERRREQETSQREAAEAAAQVAFLLHARHAQLFGRSRGDSNPSSQGPPVSASPPVAEGVV